MTTRYEVRRNVRTDKAKGRQMDRQYAQAEHIDAVCRRLETAWQRAHGKEISVRYTAGWYRFMSQGDKGRQLREAEVIKLADRLEAMAADLIDPDKES